MSRIADDIAHVELPGDWTQTVSREYIDNLEDNLRGDITAEADRATQKEGELEGKFNNYTPTLDIPGIKVDQAKKADVADKLNAGATMGGKEVATTERLTDGSVTKVSDNATNVSGDILSTGLRSYIKGTKAGTWYRLYKINTQEFNGFNITLKLTSGYYGVPAATCTYLISYGSKGSYEYKENVNFAQLNANAVSRKIPKIRVARKGDNEFYIDINVALSNERISGVVLVPTESDKVTIEVISQSVDAIEADTTYYETIVKDNCIAFNGIPLATIDGTVENANYLINHLYYENTNIADIKENGFFDIRLPPNNLPKPNTEFSVMKVLNTERSKGLEIASDPVKSTLHYATINGGIESNWNEVAVVNQVRSGDITKNTWLRLFKIGNRGATTDFIIKSEFRNYIPFAISGYITSAIKPEESTFVQLGVTKNANLVFPYIRIARDSGYNIYLDVYISASVEKVQSIKAIGNSFCKPDLREVPETENGFVYQKYDIIYSESIKVNGKELAFIQPSLAQATYATFNHGIEGETK